MLGSLVWKLEANGHINIRCARHDGVAKLLGLQPKPSRLRCFYGNQQTVHAWDPLKTGKKATAQMEDAHSAELRCAGSAPFCAAAGGFILAVGPSFVRPIE